MKKKKITQRSARRLARLYHEMAEAETDPPAKARLEETAETLDVFISANGYFDAIVEQVEEHINCGILSQDLDFTVCFPGWKREVVR